MKTIRIGRPRQCSRSRPYQSGVPPHRHRRRRAPERWAARTSGRGRRASPRRPAGRGKRDGTAGEAGSLPDPPDLLGVTAQRLRRALARSFLRYGVPGDPEVAVHAAMNVVEPVLQARDTEILRLRRLRSAKVSGR